MEEAELEILTTRSCISLTQLLDLLSKLSMTDAETRCKVCRLRRTRSKPPRASVNILTSCAKLVRLLSAFLKLLIVLTTDLLADMRSVTEATRLMSVTGSIVLP